MGGPGTSAIIQKQKHLFRLLIALAKQILFAMYPIPPEVPTSEFWHVNPILNNGSKGTLQLWDNTSFFSGSAVL